MSNVQKFIMSCPFCKGQVECEVEWIGLKGECPYCNKKFIIEQPLECSESIDENNIEQQEKHTPLDNTCWLCSGTGFEYPQSQNGKCLLCSGSKVIVNGISHSGIHDGKIIGRQNTPLIDFINVLWLIVGNYDYFLGNENIFDEAKNLKWHYRLFLLCYYLKIIAASTNDELLSMVQNTELKKHGMNNFVSISQNLLICEQSNIIVDKINHWCSELTEYFEEQTENKSIDDFESPIAKQIFEVSLKKLQTATFLEEEFWQDIEEILFISGKSALQIDECNKASIESEIKILLDKIGFSMSSDNHGISSFKAAHYSLPASCYNALLKKEEPLTCWLCDSDDSNFYCPLCGNEGVYLPQYNRNDGDIEELMGCVSRDAIGKFTISILIKFSKKMMQLIQNEETDSVDFYISRCMFFAYYMKKFFLTQLSSISEEDLSPIAKDICHKNSNLLKLLMTSLQVIGRFLDDQENETKVASVVVHLYAIEMLYHARLSKLSSTEMLQPSSEIERIIKNGLEGIE